MSTFTYDLTTTAGKIRREIGDTRFEDGILPEGRNFSDAEVTYFYTQQDESFWLAVAAAFDAAAAEWARYPEDMSLGPERQKINAARFYTQKADSARSKALAPGAYDVSKADYAIDVDATAAEYS